MKIEVGATVYMPKKKVNGHYKVIALDTGECGKALIEPLEADPESGKKRRVRVWIKNLDTILQLTQAQLEYLNDSQKGELINWLLSHFDVETGSQVHEHINWQLPLRLHTEN